MKKFDIAFNKHIEVFLESDVEYTLETLKNADLMQILNDITMAQQTEANGWQLVIIDVNKFDKLWKKSDPYFYINRGESDKSQYKKAIGFFLATPEERYDKYDKATSIYASEVDVSDDLIGVIQGRHRYAVLRDAGVTKMPVAMSPNSIEKAREMGLIE